MLFIGKNFTSVNSKWVHLGSPVVFEVGSGIFGAAPNSTVLVIGRANADLGNADLFQDAVVIIVSVVPLHK